VTAEEREFLYRIEAKIDQQIARADNLSQVVSGHHLTLFGEKGSNGLNGDVIRLKERDDTRRRFLAVSLSAAGIVAGLAGAFGAAVIKVIWGG
jgi:hypothetical protein